MHLIAICYKPQETVLYNNVSRKHHTLTLRKQVLNRLIGVEFLGHIAITQEHVLRMMMIVG